MQTNRELLARLKFIAKIQPLEKLSIYDMKVYPDNLFTTILRSIYRDNSRSKTLSFLEETIDKSFEVVHNYKNSEKISDQIMVKNIIDDLRSCKESMSNLKKTYTNDRIFCCEIDIIIDCISARLIDIDPFCPPPIFDEDKS